MEFYANMKFDPAIHHRRSIRLKDYDYTLPGAYFVTIVTQEQKLILGEVVNDEVVLTPFGRMIFEAWQDLPHHYAHVELGEFIVMPNHVHGVIILKDENCGRGGSPELCSGWTRPYRHDLPEIVRALKSFSSQRINAMRRTPGLQVWQRNYYEHIIRNEGEMALISAYIQANPVNWQIDKEYARS